MKKAVVFADVLFAVLFSLLFSMQTMSTYSVVAFFVILSFLVVEVLFILLARRWYIPIKWLGIILMASIVLSHIPKALVLVSLNQYGYIVLLVALFVVALFRTICSFLVKDKSN